MILAPRGFQDHHRESTYHLRGKSCVTSKRRCRGANGHPSAAPRAACGKSKGTRSSARKLSSSRWARLVQPQALEGSKGERSCARLPNTCTQTGVATGGQGTRPKNSPVVDPFASTTAIPSCFGMRITCRRVASSSRHRKARIERAPARLTSPALAHGGLGPKIRKARGTPHCLCPKWRIFSLADEFPPKGHL